VAVLRDAISDAQSLRAAELQSMKWLSELHRAHAMIHSFDFIVVKRNRIRRDFRSKSCGGHLTKDVFNDVVGVRCAERSANELTSP
jgi:hypothetical protein